MREIDEDERREAIDQRRMRARMRRPRYHTYDDWKLASPEDEMDTPEPPPCQRGYAGRLHQRPRYPSGDCVVCGALCTEGCKHELAVGEYAEGDEP